MYGYHEMKGHFPPAYVADVQGRPAHSWRVLLLQSGMETLYERYHFDEPWDGPRNRSLANGLPFGMSESLLGIIVPPTEAPTGCTQAM